ncbi:heparinase II/III domain-containing protein [Polaribacter sargassicola]|uniref:heparinase II/III domain-containing protein n=1 Tax=Polaribacter sargassicola TaxID=2836891 RepID=UPI001F210480|nr:heparinase II/III family protein [Polaribacter sp. DS7-9]MCG1037448.1 heparinase II/III family protein [Polaribacter sp. DS7-9]
MKRILIFTVLFFVSFFTWGQQLEHPRIYTTNDSKTAFLERIANTPWKNFFLDKKKENLDKYLNYVAEDATWLVSRLQMNWKTKHDKVFLKGGDFHHSEGKAPVPTVRFSGTRDWATNYNTPKLEEVIPYLDDERGFYVTHKKTHQKEWVKAAETGHMIENINARIMSLVQDAAFLYWVTGDKKYAEFAKPVFETYILGMYYREAPVDLENGNQQGISGLATFEVIHEKILINLITTYDFLYDYFKEEKVDLEKTAAVFQRWGDQIIEKGIPDNNWNLFQARFLTYVALILDENKAYQNKKGREYFLEYTFNTSTARQLSVKESLLVYDQKSGIWPECPSYSVHVITTLLDIFTLLDNATNRNELSNFPMIEKAALASFNYLFPSGYLLGFGDSGHKSIPPENFELLISNYRKYQNKEKEENITNLLAEIIKKGEYKRKANSLFELFFYVDELAIDKETKADISKMVSPTFYSANVSLFNQRLGKGNDATMVATVGSYGNHSHANGISLELFANNYVLGPDSGKGSSYWHSDFKEYYSKFAAHNTVIVDGKSDYQAMRGYHPFVLEQSFPKSGEVTNFKMLTFSNVSFFEPKTKSKQQRFTAIVKGNQAKSYIVDVFRSKKQAGGIQRHDYLYHNLGQSLELLSVNGNALKLQATDDFGSKHGDIKGFDYLSSKKKASTDKDVQAIFRLQEKNKSDNLMKIWVKGSQKQSIYKALSPRSNAISKGTAPIEVLKDSLATLIVKREAEAWDNPFAMVFNPYIDGEENPIKNVSFGTSTNNFSTQKIAVLLSDEITTDYMILNASEEEVVEEKEFYQKGLFSIKRKIKDSNAIDYLFLSGMYKYESDGWQIIASGLPINIAIESTANGFEIENSDAALIRIPFLNGKKSAELKVYENGKLISRRQGQINRSNPNQLEFRLSKAYEKAVIVY